MAIKLAGTVPPDHSGVWLAVGHLRLASILEAAEPHLAAARVQAVIDTLTIRPGDRLVIRASGVLSQEQGEELLDRARAALLPGRDVPILIADDTAAFRLIPTLDMVSVRANLRHLGFGLYDQAVLSPYADDPFKPYIFVQYPADPAAITGPELRAAADRALAAVEQARMEAGQ